MKSSSKRTKNFTSVTYSSSSNSEGSASCGYDPTLPLEDPVGQRDSKRKSKAKAAETSFNNNDYIVVQDILSKKVCVMEKWAHLKEVENKIKQGELKFKALEVLLKDTSRMTENQHRDHEIFCNMLKEKYVFS